MVKHKVTTKRRLSAAVQRALRARVEAEGARAVAAHFGVSIRAIERGIAGLEQLGSMVNHLTAAVSAEADSAA